MCNEHPPYPWMFRRDDVDLFEDRLEDLYNRFQDAGNRHQMEQEVLAEQQAFESALDEEMTLVMNDVSHLPFMQTDTHNADEEFVVPALVSRWQEDALFQTVRDWSEQVLVFARNTYEDAQFRNRTVFRLYASTHLVPIKLASALSEEGMDDDAAQAFALIEHERAQACLVQVLGDLEQLLKQLELSIDIQPLLVRGVRLLADMKKRQSLLQRRMPRR